MRPRDLLWTMLFLLFDREADKRPSGVFLAVVVVLLAIAVMVMLAVPIVHGWAR